MKSRRRRKVQSYCKRLEYLRKQHSRARAKCIIVVIAPQLNELQNFVSAPRVVVMPCASVEILTRIYSTQSLVSIYNITQGYNNYQ